MNDTADLIQAAQMSMYFENLLRTRYRAKGLS